MGFRGRVLGLTLGLLAVAIIGGVFVQRAIRLDRLDREVDAALDQEREELELLTAGRNPATGEEFGTDVRAIFDTFLRRNVPAADEVYIAFYRGELHATTAAPYALHRDPELVETWHSGEEGRRTDISTPAGPVRYIATPLRQEDETLGVFVVAFFLQDRLDELSASVRIGLGTSLVMLAIATLAAWFITGRLLRPLAEMTERARMISETDLSGRIQVVGDDEVAELATTFNEMLDRLEGAFDVQRRFVDDAGHELRTPITIIRGHLELMGDDPEERAETIALVTDELDRMARIVDDLLLLAKAEQPDFIRTEPTELSDFTTELLVKASALGDRDWQLEACGEGMVRVDPQRLSQAVLNLARNAVEHSRPRSRIAIGSDLHGDDLRFWVRDEGTGIPADEQDRIFGRFARGDGARRRSDGAGLGLAIVRAVAEGHGGRVELESAPGAGSTFTLVLSGAAIADTNHIGPVEDTHADAGATHTERPEPSHGS